MSARTRTRPSAATNAARGLYYRLRATLDDEGPWRGFVEIAEEQVTSTNHAHAQVIPAGVRDHLVLTPDEAAWLARTLATMAARARAMRAEDARELRLLERCDRQGRLTPPRGPAGGAP